MSECIQEMNRFFYTRKTYDIERRIFFLKKLKKVILSYQKEIVNALYADFNKPAFETYTTEIYTVILELNEAIKSIRKWTKSEKHKGSLPIIGGETKIMKEPYGVCAIFSPYNYPFQLAITPMIGALSAGNCVVIKPSEYTPATNAILKKIIHETFPPYYVQIIEGDAQVAQALLNEPIDYIFFYWRH